MTTSPPARVGRAIGIDFGERRIGVARSDPSRTLASPLTVIQRGRRRSDDHRAIIELADEHEADLIVVGLPRSLNGKEGPAAQAVQQEVAQLRAAIGSDTPEVVVHDERFTTTVAERALMEARMRREARKHVVDKVAAAVMLQSFLDTAARAQNPEPPGDTE